jgi:cyclomaltodextrin glucanotransferase
MRGRPEHAGNRNYFGQERVDAAPQSPIYQALKRIANLRRTSVALQRGLQLDERLRGDIAVFYRVYENAGTNQTALVVLNKGDAAQAVEVGEHLQPGAWRDGFSGETATFGSRANIAVPGHGVRVYFYDKPLTLPATRARLAHLMASKGADSAAR